MFTQSKWNPVRTLRMLALAGLALITAACAAQGAAVDARFEAGWRPSKTHCLFGGETRQVDAYCAWVNFGDHGVEAVARGANQEILQDVAGQTLRCTDHVALAKAKLGTLKDYSTTELYSCDRNPQVENGQKVCHVSLLVTDRRTGARVVMDNGHVLDPLLNGGVASYDAFVQKVGYVWTNNTPATVALGSAD